VTDIVGREPQYEAAAENYRDHAADGLWNAHLDRPACLELLGDVSGKDVLDAACGPGYYAAELISRGARVTGFDNSPRMVEFCRRLPGGGEFRVHDLNDPIDWLPDASVDLVLCALAYEYADNRAGALREFRRVLKPGGALVLSKRHPAGDWLRHGGSYFDTRIVEERWGGSLNMGVRFWIEPLEAICAAIAAAGFLIERLVEPCPAPSGAALAPVSHERLSTGPYGSIAFRLRPAPYTRAGGLRRRARPA
jgi:SAM-dependent methyltransferase